MSSEFGAHAQFVDGEIIDDDNATNVTQPQPAQILFRVGMTMEEVERQMLFTTLAFFNNHKPKAAQALGISLKTVYNRLARFGQVDNASEIGAVGA